MFWIIHELTFQHQIMSEKNPEIVLRPKFIKYKVMLD